MLTRFKVYISLYICISNSVVHFNTMLYVSLFQQNLEKLKIKKPDSLKEKKGVFPYNSKRVHILCIVKSPNTFHFINSL